MVKDFSKRSSKYLQNIIHFIYCIITNSQIPSTYCSDFGKCNPVTIGNVSPEREIPQHIKVPEYYHREMSPGNTIGIPEIKTSAQIDYMRASCKLASNILKSCQDIVKV